MDFPAIVYRTPGPHGRPGKTYAYQGVEDQDALDHALANGWYESKVGAFASLEAKKIVKEVAEAKAAVDDVSPATRDEMEQKAKELGIRGVHLMKDETLAERIAGLVA